MRFQSSQAVLLKGILDAQVTGLGRDSLSPILASEPIAEFRHPTTMATPWSDSDSTGKATFNDDGKMLDRFFAEVTAYPLSSVLLRIWINKRTGHPSRYQRIIGNSYKSNIVTFFIRT